MGCKYCVDCNPLLTKDVDNNNLLWWSVGSVLTKDMLNLTAEALVVTIDRGHLRLSDPEDNQCLGHGESIKIDYCPVCGTKLTY